MGAGHGVEHEAGVVDGARRRRDVGEVGEALGRHVVRDQAERLLQADDAIAGGRNARRAAGAGGDGERADAGGAGSGRATRGAAGGARLIPGVARLAEQRRFGPDHVAELRRGGFADEHGAGGFEAGDGDGVVGGHVVLEHQRAEGGAHACGIDEVLHVQWDASEVARVFAARDLGVDKRGIAQGFVAADGDEAVEDRLDGVDACERGAGDLDGRGLPGADGVADFGGGGVGDCGGHVAACK